MPTSIKENLAYMCAQYIGQDVYSNSSGAYRKRVCLGIQTSAEVEVAKQNKTVTDLIVANGCFGYFFALPNSEDIRCPVCVEHMMRMPKKRTLVKK